MKRDKISLNKLREFSAQFIDGTPEGYSVLNRVYPEHVYDSLRRKIAVELAGKKIAKITEAENNQQLVELQRAVADLYDGREGIYAPVHDFWSFVEMVLHVKKKGLPELITAQNVIWTEEDLPIDQLHITWMPFLEQRKDLFGPKPWQITNLQRVFSQKPGLRKQAQEEQQQVVGDQQHNFDQSDEPITIVYRNEHLELIDGNGRLYNAFLNNQEMISCYIGRLHGKIPANYWVSAGSLKQFCLEVRGYKGIDTEGFVNGLNYLRTKLSNNTIALINYELFLREEFPEFEESLKNIVPSD